MKKFITFLISVLDRIFPKKNKQIVYTSFPDFSDNSFAMFIYMANNHKEYKNIWIVNATEKTSLYKNITSNYTNNNEYIIVDKNSIISLYYYLTSKFVFFTHGLYTGVKVPNSHIVVNLWHGMPLKTIGYLDSSNVNGIQNANYAIATSPIYQTLISKSFNLDINNVLISGQPRNDFLLSKDKGILEKFGVTSTIKKIFVWMPTYRKSIIGDIRVDGDDTGLLPILSIEDLGEVNDVLKRTNSFMFIKLHPMDALILTEFKKYSHLSIVKNSDFEKVGIQLYSLLANADFLLTDYSSVYVDFLLTGMPIAFVMEDMNSFTQSRGFVFKNPIQYMPGDFISDKNQFLEFLTSPIKHKHYDTVSNQLNTVVEKFSKNIYTNLIEKYRKG